MPRTIFHVDVNSAFLSWSALEALKKDPGSVDLRTIPSAVGGDVKTRHGVITARSIPAKKFGVKTGEPVVKALQKCPNLVLVPSDFTAYRRNSHAFMDLLAGFSPVLEQLSIDEAFLDMTDALDRFPGKDDREKALAAAEEIRARVRGELLFTVNVGISSNRLLAKTASDFTKPDKTHTLYPEEIPAKFWVLPIEDLYGCGGATAGRLRDFGIRTVGDAARTDRELLQNLLGDKSGAYIHAASNGRSSDVIEPVRERAKSYSNETTTSVDITADNYVSDAFPILESLSARVAGRMKKDRVVAQTIGVMVKTTGFSRRSKQVSLPDPTNDEALIQETVRRLFEELCTGEEGLFARGFALRLLGASAGTITDEGGFRQLSLFDGFSEAPAEEAPSPAPAPEKEKPEAEEKPDPAPSEKESKGPSGTANNRKQALDSMLASLNGKFGKGSIGTLSSLENRLP